MNVAATSLRAELPFTSAAPGLARDQVREFARGLPAGTLDDALLMVSELVTNAVRHGRPEVTLDMVLSPDSLTVAVDDGGRAPVTCRVPTPDQEHGRGLWMVAALAAHWGVARGGGDHGTQVWFELAAC
jgi:anti-sigma regulatory factor (Ser/Thr protein kinase)